MPQGSDFYQRQAYKEKNERCDLETVCAELEQMRLRVRELEELVATMAQRLDIKTPNWSFWK